MNSNLYPASPQLNNYKFIEPSSEFRRVTIAVVFSIILFFFFNLILIALASLIMIASEWAGITIIAAKPSFITLAAGAGIIALGVMFFVFLFKFIFSRTKNENPFRIEIRQTEHPELFSFIKALNTDTKTKFPKKIFISPEVNAMVFYNSSFWSLFFPVRKSLEIGLGLVNTLMVSEFKAVLALEELSLKFQNFANKIYSQPRWTEDAIKMLAAELAALEKQFKDFLTRQNMEIITLGIDATEQKEALKEYINSNKYYSKTYELNEQSFINLLNLIQNVYNSLNIQYGNNLNKLTDYQLELENKLVKN